MRVHCADILSPPAIIAQNRVGPKFAAQARKPPVSDDQLPLLRQASDVMWGLWDVPENPQLDDLNYYMCLRITNLVTQNIITSTMIDADKELGPWPGAEFRVDMGNDAVLALLGMKSKVPLLLERRLGETQSTDKTQD